MAPGAVPPVTSQYGRQHDVAFMRDGVQPPSALYIPPGCNLMMIAVNAGAAVTIYFTAEMLSPDGVAIPFLYPFPLIAVNGFVQQAIPLPEGYLLRAGIWSNGGNSRDRLLLGMLHLERPGPAGLPVRQTLLYGYPATERALLWPPAVYEQPGSTIAPNDRVAIVNPAAGAEINIVSPARAMWVVRRFTFQFTAAAGGGNRVPTIGIPNLGMAGTFIGANTAVPPGTTAYFEAGHFGFCGAVGGAKYLIPLPERVILYPGSSILTATAGIQAADQYSNIWLDAERWAVLS